MTTQVYWSEVAQEAPAASQVFWAELEHVGEPARVFWAEVEITAEVGEAITGSADIPELTTVEFGGGFSEIAAGEEIDLPARFLDQDGDPIPNLSGSPESSDTDVATVSLLAPTDDNGESTVRVTGVSGGAADISIGADGQGSTTQAVTVIDITTVVLTVQTISLEVGLLGTASALVLDQNDNPVAGAVVSWDSSSPSVIASPANSVTNSAGIAQTAFTALAAGTTSFTATAGGIDSYEVTVTVVAVTPPSTYSAVGASRIVLTAEKSTVGWERPRTRRFSAAEHRRLNPTDAFFDGWVDDVETEIVWPTKQLLLRGS